MDGWVSDYFSPRARRVASRQQSGWMIDAPLTLR
jgi:hypothetical protein